MTVLLEGQTSSSSSFWEDGPLPFPFTLQYQRGSPEMGRESHNTRLTCFSRDFQYQRKAAKQQLVFPLLFIILSLEQRQHRSGMVGIVLERCWIGYNNSYLRLLYVPVPCIFYFCLTCRISICPASNRQYPITYEQGLICQVVGSSTFLVSCYVRARCTHSHQSMISDNFGDLPTFYVVPTSV